MAATASDWARSAGAYLAALAFTAAFLVSSFTGAEGLTPVVRGVVVSIAAYLIGSVLTRAAFSTILDAMARDRVQDRNDTEVDR